jgi:hypothetical protein
MARLAVFRRIALAALFISGSAAAIPEPDDFIGPPSYTLMGCSLAELWTPEYVREATGLSEKQLRRAEQKFGFAPKRVCASDPRLIEGMVNPKRPKSKPDEPDKAIAQRIRSLQDSNGTIPPNALQNALAQREVILEPPPKTLEKSAGIAPNAWTWIGPGNIGGRVRAISPDPLTSGRILLGSVSGGIWLTTNSGTSWSVVDDFLPNVAVTCLVRDPQVPATIYACTGEGFFNFDGIRGQGVFKSTNNGATWAQVNCTNPASSNCPSGTPSTDWNYVNRLAVSPTNSQVILAATNNGLYRSADGGNSWTKVYQAVGTSGGVAKFRRVLDVRFHPTDGTKAVLGEGKHLNCLSGCVNDGAAVAYSSDGGATWARTKLNTSAISGQGGRVELAWSKSNPTIVYAVVDQNFGELYKSTTSGASWTPDTPVSNPGHLGSQGWYDNAVWVAPNDPNRLIVAGFSMAMSLNGGTTWTQVGDEAHVDHHIIVEDKNYTSNFTIYNGNDGGIYKGTQVGTNNPVSTVAPTFDPLNNNLGITQFYGAAGKAGGRITGGAQDNGTLLWTGTTDWVQIWGSDGGTSAADQTDGNYVYGMTQYGGIVRYTQALAADPPGYDSFYICNGITDASCNFNNNNPTIRFIPPMDIDPNTSTTLYLGGQSFWRSTNIKTANPDSVTWTAIRGPKPVNPNLGYIPWISAVSVKPGNSNIVWIGYDDGSVGCTTNALAASPTWVNVTMPAATALRVVSRIVFDPDPNNPNHVYVSWTGYLASSPGTNLWHAVVTNGCSATPSWANIHNQLPLAPIRAIAVHPSNPQWLYAGTEVGVFASQNGGANWSTTNDGPGTTSVEELFFLDSTKLVASTHGRGMFTALALPGTAPTFTSSPPANGSVGVAYTHNYTANGSPAPTFSITSGAFPAGLTLNGTTGVLSGTPSAGGTNSTGVVTATNTSGTATQSFSITISAQLPGAPTIGTATAGNAQATVSFTPPASNGGATITSYTVTCGAIQASGAGTPITVTGLANGTNYNCFAQATNSAGTGPASGTVSVTPSSGVTLALLSVKSRKTHPVGGDQDLTITTSQPLAGSITVEPRIIGAGHKIVFVFNDVITATGTVACRDAALNPVGSASATAVGTTVEVVLTGVPDAKRVTVSLTGVNGTLNTSAPVGFLLGDVNNNYKVTSTDILSINGRIGQAISPSNFKYDVNVSGSISTTDVNTVKAQTGQILP